MLHINYCKVNTVWNYMSTFGSCELSYKYKTVVIYTVIFVDIIHEKIKEVYKIEIKKFSMYNFTFK